MFLQSITKTVTKALDASTAIPAVADASLSGRRHAVGIYAVASAESSDTSTETTETTTNTSSGGVYVGGKDVTADTGILIPAGEYRVFPVNNAMSLYVVGGKCVVADFF